MSDRPLNPAAARRLRQPGRLGRVFKVAVVALIVTLAGFGLAEYLGSGLGQPTLVIYTYPSLLGGADCNGGGNGAVFGTVFGQFESAHHVRIDVECPPGTLVSTLLSQQNAPAADLVIGLDEITAPQAEAHHLLIPFVPPAIADISPQLVSEVSPDYGVIPYEFGYLAIDYDTTFDAMTHGAIARATFPDFVANASWAHQLLIENPYFDITGEEFLVWQIEYYEHVLHQNWTAFWTSTLPNLPPLAPDWGTAFAEFTTPPANPLLVVSYSTDPAYAAANGEAGLFNSTVSWWNGTQYGWRTIYGIGIVQGTRHLAVDEEFENWFLSPTVQSEIPENEWEYPANETVPVPPVFSAALDPSQIVALNADTTPQQVAANLTGPSGWLETWLSL